MKTMTPKQRVMAVLNHQKPDMVPFTVYDDFLHMCMRERQLRNDGMCLVRRVSSHRSARPNVKVTTHGYTNDRGRYMVRTHYETPVGTLTTLDEPVGFTTWHWERMFKSPDDYAALLFMLKDTVITPDYGPIAHIEADLGEDYVVRDQIPLEPLQQLVSDIMGPLVFGYQWMDNRDEVLRLYDAIVENNRKTYEIVANGPLQFANYGGNVIPAVTGPQVFRDYFVPHYNEAAEILHRRGKLIGTHLDDSNTTILPDIAATDLDYIEAYDLSFNPPLAKSLKAMPGKVLWLNWPCAWQLNPPQEIERLTRDMFHGTNNGKDVIVGITDNVPPESMYDQFEAIMRGLPALCAE